MAFDDPVAIEPSALKLAVHVRGGDERPERWASRQLEETKNPGAGTGGPIQVQAVSVEASRKVWIVIEPTRIGQVDERQTELAIGLGRRSIIQRRRESRATPSRPPIPARL
jgi:hypothetical protein